MKAAVLKKIEHLVIEERKKPKPAPGEVLVKVEAVGVCGSDVHYYRQGRIGSQIVKRPIIIGHEAAGRIAGLGAGVRDIKTGTPVAMEPGVPCGKCEWCFKGLYNLCPDIRFFGTPPVDGAYVEYLTHPRKFVFPLPRKMSYEEGAMLEPLSVGVHAVELAQVKPGDTAAVIGAGSIGLSCLQAVKAGGATRVFISDLLQPRLELAGKLGADVTVDAGRENIVEVVMKETGGRGVDVAIEAVGSAETFQQTFEVACRNANVVLVGIWPEGKVSLDLDSVRRKGLTIKNVRRFRHCYPRAIDLVSRGKADVKSYVTHRFPLRRIVEAFKMVEDYADGVVKAVVYPGR